MSSKRRRGGSKAVGFIILGLLALVTYAGWRVVNPSPAKADPGETTTVADQNPASGPDETHRTVADAGESVTGANRTDSSERAKTKAEKPKPDPVLATPVLTMGETTIEAPPAKTTGRPASQPAGRLTPPALAQPAEPIPQVKTKSLTESVKQLVSLAEKKRAEGDLVGARELYLRALYHADATEADRDELRPQITALNDDILFSPKLYPTEPMTRMHRIVKGDYISTLPSRQHLAVDKDLIARINHIADPNKIRLGQKIKLITGPFHAEVIKSKFRIDIYSGPRDEPSRWRYIRSFPVGLGDTGVDSGTPVGEFVVSHSKVTNPSWANPNTGEQFDADDPNNPIGEFWVGLTGLGTSAGHIGYGIHGTVDPSSIGNSRSMGCVRLHDADIAFVYELLVPEKSRVRILP
jgi:L,D-transpeptidase catalytic domain/LysM domain